MSAGEAILVMTFIAGLATSSCAAVGIVALVAKRKERGATRAAREAVTRAALLETALADVRHRRSTSVSKGNRTRGAAQAKLRNVRMAELQEAIALKRAGGQRSLPLESAPLAGNTP